MHTPENILFDNISLFSEFLDQFLHLVTFGTSSAATGYTVLCESACALNEVELIVIPPCYNVNLRTIIGYHKDDMEYNFLDDYNERGK